MLETTLTHKVAIVTGAGRRIGAEIARTLYAAGANLVLHYLNSQHDAEKLCAELNEARAQSAITIAADLTKEADLQQLVTASFNHWQRLDILVNNASKYYRSELGKVSTAEWDDLMHSNLRAPFFLAQYAFPYLKTTHGCIVNITDIYGERPLLDYPVYTITKGALISTTKVLAKQMAPEIRVNAVSPGQMVWPEGENMLSAQEQQAIIAKIALKKPGNAEAIAKAVLFLARDAEYVTGQIISVDGGRLLFG